MLSLILGTAGFALFFVYDINSVTARSRLLHSCFTLGVVLIGAATALDLGAAWRAQAVSGLLDWVLVLCGLGFLGALVHALFFALPFEATYADAENKARKVYDRGVYALCRHPGVLWFFGMYLFLGLAALPGALLLHGMVFSALNVAYILLQDLVTFPRTFQDYRAYRRTTPFLIPNARSLRRAWETRRHPKCKEEKR